MLRLAPRQAFQVSFTGLRADRGSKASRKAWQSPRGELYWLVTGGIISSLALIHLLSLQNTE